MTKDAHTGSSFDSFLMEEDVLDEVEAVAIKRVIAWQLAEQMKKQHITKVTMAETLHTSRSQIDRLLDPKNASVHLTTLARAAHAVGMRFALTLAPIAGKQRASAPGAAPRPLPRTKRQMEHA